MSITTFDCTPSWVSLLPLMLELSGQFDKDVRRKKPSAEVSNHRDELRLQFKAMAIAADNWNTHCKQIK